MVAELGLTMASCQQTDDTIWPRQMLVGWGGRWYCGPIAGVTQHANLQKYQSHLETPEASWSEGKEEALLGARDWGRVQLLRGARRSPRKARRDCQITHQLFLTRRVMSWREENTPARTAGDALIAGNQKRSGMRWGDARTLRGAEGD